MLRSISGTGLVVRFRLWRLIRVWNRVRDASALSFRRGRGDVGWLIATERRYAPTVERSSAVRSPLDPRGTGDLGVANIGGDKMAFTRNGYAPMYAASLRPWRNRDLVVVELGVFRGTGLALWSDLFPNARLLGLDLEFSRFEENLTALRRRGAFRGSTPTLVPFDAFAPDVGPLERALGGRTIDVFIDDGPHVDEAIVMTFSAVRHLLSVEFRYVIEDNDRAASILNRQYPELRVTAAAGWSLVQQGS